MNHTITNDETTLVPAFSGLWENIINTLDQSLIDSFDIHLHISEQHTENWDKETWSDKSGWKKNWEKSDG